MPIAENVGVSEPRGGGKKSIWCSPSPTLSHTEAVIETEETPSKKRGRPTKVDIAKERSLKASAEIRALVESKPSDKDVSAWIKQRLAQLNV